jgi:predicted ArsR family transcriptional regulator
VEIDQALDAPTRERVARAILELGPSTAAALAERLQLTPAAVRRHLDLMIERGAVEAREPRVYGARGRGRPAKTTSRCRRCATSRRPAVTTP